MKNIEEFQFSDRFTINAEVRSGEAWKMYRAHDHRTNKEVALKVVTFSKRSALMGMRKELSALTELSHPNIVSFYDSECRDNFCYITSELIEGVTFLEYVRPDVGDPSTFDETRLRFAWSQLVAAIEALHQKGLVHRDLKPTNVVVRDSHVFILDFGGSAMEGFELMGTPNYMAPEIGAQGRATPASDWYSAGVMLYEALTGQQPFAGMFSEVLIKKQVSDPVSPIALEPAIPLDLNDLCMRLLKRDPLKRPSGSEVLSLLTDNSPPHSTESLEAMISDLPADARDEARRFIESLLSRRRKSNNKLQQNWAGGLRDYREEYTSLELQKRALGWRGD